MMVARSIRRAALAGICFVGFVGQAIAADLSTVPHTDYCAVAGTATHGLREGAVARFQLTCAKRVVVGVIAPESSALRARIARSNACGADL